MYIYIFFFFKYHWFCEIMSVLILGTWKVETRPSYLEEYTSEFFLNSVFVPL